MEQNKALKQRFLSLIENNKVSHSYIIAGGDGSGKGEAAKFFAKAVLCGGEPCGRCQSCRKAEMNVNPDIIEVNADGEGTFKIEEIRHISETVNIPPVEGRKKIYILHHCENLTVQAQNAFLKVFEEPPEHVMFFMLTEKKEALLPTILSRATLYTVHPMDKRELSLLLEKKFPKESKENISDAVRLSEGFYGRAVKFLEKSALAERKTAIELSSYVLGEKSAYKAAKLLGAYKNKRETATRLLFLLLYAVRDTVLYKKGGKELCFLSETEAEKYSNNSHMRLTKLSDSILETAVALKSNGNYTSCIAVLCGTIL